MGGTIDMMTKLKSLYDQNRFYEALTIITKEIDRLKSLRLSELKQELNKIKSAEDFQVLIRLTDHLLMYQYSSFIARYAYRRFPTLVTLTWYCEELLDNGKLLEADELVTNTIAENQEGTEELEKLYFCKIRCLLEMKRFGEAERMLDKVNESSNALQDKLGYVYMQIGNREKAEEYFLQGLNHPEKGRVCYLLLADLKAANGQLEEALSIIEMGEKHYPETPSFLLEKVRRYRDLGKMKEMLEIIKELNELIPEHAYQKYFHHLLGIAYYQLGDIASLEAYSNKEKRKKSLYTVKNEQGELIKLNIKPIIQKSNYCVPASLEMILTFFGMVISQDEIARYIFDFTGSKLSTTVDYLENNGYECRYFVGSKERYTKLLKKNIPILLSVDFEHSSHVQVMTGYDSRFDFYHIQDPNLLETMYMAASDLEKANVSTTYLSIVCVPKERAEELAFLSMEEDEYFRRLQDLGEKIEEDEAANKEEFLEFLKVNIDVPYSAIYVVKHFSFEEYSDFILHCADKLLELYPDNDFMNLHVAQAYMRLHKMDQAREMLTRTVWKTFSSLYHFLHGRIALYFDEVKDAIVYFRNSLQLDPDQYYTWSYLALAYLYSNDVKNAEYFSSISMELAPREKFVRINHAAVLIEREEYDEARNIYDQLIRDEPGDGHTWFERARLDQKLGKIRKALRGYLMAIKLEEDFPLAFLAAADLYEYELEEPAKVEEILQSGLNTNASAPLLVRLGDFYREHDKSDLAVSCYQECIDLFPDERFAYIGIAEILAIKKDKKIAADFLKSHIERFKEDSEFMINSGRIMAEWGLEEDGEEALNFIEEGMNSIHSNIKEALELYVSIVEETPFIGRALDFLKQKFAVNPDLIEYKCYEGMLYEIKKQYSLAINCYNIAIQTREDTFPFYRLGEVYFHLGMYELADEAFKNCLRIDPKFESAFVRLAEIASFSEDQQKEAEYLIQLLDFAPLNVNIEYLVSILEEDEKRILLNKLQILPKKINKIWRLDAEAYVYGSLGKINLEQERVNKALKIDPNFSELLHHQAKIFIKEKKWSKVREILLLLLNKDPENEDLYRTLTTYSAEANKWSRLPIFLTKLAGNRKTRSTWFLLDAEAVKQFIIEMNWDDEEQGNVFGRFVRKLKNRTKQINLFGTAIELYEMAIKLDKSNLSAVSQFAGFYEQFELIDDSIKILQKALKNNWDKHLAYQLAMNYMKKENFSSALPLFERLLNGEPADTHLHYMAALIHCELGELSIAEQMMKRIIGMNPFEHGVHLLLGRLYNEQGRYMEAKDILEIGKEYHPYDSDISDELGLTHQHLENSIVLCN
jgi:tetratricopeptide (TPR) repeat protein